MRAILRSGLVAVAVVAGLSACGKKEEAAPTAAAPAAEDKVLNVYNWSDYIAEGTVGDFQTKTGIKVNYDVFDSNEVLETKLLAGRTGYDVVVPSASFLERQIKAGVFMKLDKSKLPNLANLDPEIMERVGKHDPGNEYAVPYLWGTTGIGYNPEKVKAALGTDTIDSWAMIFEPENAKKLQSCGLTLLDAPGEVVDSALIYLGRDPNSEAPEDLAAAEELLMKIRPFVRYLHSSQYINDLANGEICVALGWSGDILQAQARGAEAATPVEIAYAIPKEGAIMWFDMLAIPADAPHPNNAHEFINYLMEPAVIAAISNYVAYANGNSASFEMVDEAVRTDPSVYPTAEVKAKLYPHLAESQDYSRLSNRAWTRFRTGQ
ncbi:MAG: polyamine ABC transporter substrate-binding protein [Steroidobacteraceae bacterium]|jgi:putrescine transport system substrate-binding protein|nr:polyamine ABC transporter substrate-binding protein [Steroidobacteraceae bacterium]